jgi:hypothetical protein
VAQLEVQDREPEPQAGAQLQRLEPEQVERRGERVAAAAREHRDARRPPLDRVLDAELAVEPGDMAVAREQVVVVALDQQAVADVDRRRLAAEPRPALVHDDVVAPAREPVRGCEAGDAGAEDRDPHGQGLAISAGSDARSASAASSSARFRRRATTYSGRRFTSS